MMHWCKTTQHNQFSHNYNVCQSCIIIIIIKSVFHNKLSQSSAVIIELNTKFYEYIIANELLLYLLWMHHAKSWKPYQGWYIASLVFWVGSGHETSSKLELCQIFLYTSPYTHAFVHICILPSIIHVRIRPRTLTRLSAYALLLSIYVYIIYIQCTQQRRRGFCTLVPSLLLDQ